MEMVLDLRPLSILKDENTSELNELLSLYKIEIFESDMVSKRIVSILLHLLHRIETQCKYADDVDSLKQYKRQLENKVYSLYSFNNNGT